MSTTTVAKTALPGTVDARLLVRTLEEGYGSGAWHGPDLKAALDGVTDAGAFVRPASGRHNIAEIVVHHAFYVRAVRGRLAGTDPEPFVLEGEDWFGLSDERKISWRDIRALLETEYARLTEWLGALAGGRVRSPLSDGERFELVLGLTCHAVYHAGQIQLVKRLTELTIDD